MKKLNAESFTGFLAAVVMIVSLAVTEISFRTAQGWFDNKPVDGQIIGLSVLAIALMIVYGIVTMLKIKEDCAWMKIGKDVAAAAAGVCMGVVAGLVIGAIATEVAYTFFSDFNAGTVKATFMPTACTQAIVGIVLALVSILVVAIDGAFRKK